MENNNLKVCYGADFDEADAVTVVSKSFADSLTCKEVIRVDGVEFIREVPFEKKEKIVGRCGDKSVGK